MFFKTKWKNIGDAELMEKVSQGSETAFSEILDRYQNKVLQFAWRFLRDQDEAGDIAQETFLRLYRSRDSYCNNGNLKPYLFKIARNLCIDRERKKKPELWENLPEITDENTPLHALNKKEGIEAVAKAVGKLPESQRTAVILRHTEDLSYAEIAEIMGTSVSAVESLLVRGRKNLRKGWGAV